MVTWRVVDGQQGLSFSGYSATDILEQLSGCCVDDDDEETNGCCIDDGDVDQVVDFQQIKAEIGTDLNDGGDGHGEGQGDDDDTMSFCNVCFVLDQAEEDEDWCLVGEM